MVILQPKNSYYIYGVKLNKKIRKYFLVLPIIILFSITFNLFQKTIVDNDHTHYEHDSLIHIHKHTHSDSTHSHYHSSINKISFLDHFLFSSENICLILQKSNQPFELLTFYPKDLKNSLFKPPKFS